MMELIKKGIEKLKDLWKSIKEKVSAIFTTANPDKHTRKMAYLAIAASELILFYLIALFHIGLWSGRWTPWGLVVSYAEAKTGYPLWLFLLLGGGLFALICYFLQVSTEPEEEKERPVSDSNTYGSARIAKEEEIKQVADIGPIEDITGAILGKMDESEDKLIGTKSIANFNANVLGIAPPGFGKTFTYVLNCVVQAIRRGESVITTDTKGEIWAKTVELARRFGYIVKRIDFKNPACSDGWDILGELRCDDIRAIIAANIIMKNTGDPNDIHAGAEEALLKAVCLYIALDDATPPEQKTLYNAYALLLEGYQALDIKFNAIKFDPKMRVAYDAYANSMQGSEKLRGNIFTNLCNRLSILSSPAIRDMTSIPDVDLTMPGKQKTIIYVEMPDQHNSMKVLATLFFSFLFWDLTDYADEQMDQRLPVMTNVIIEEAYAVGELPTLTNALSTVRSRGIKISLIIQAISQFYILYGEDVTNTIINCCGTFFCLGAGSPDTTELFSWMAGEATINVKTEHHTVGEGPIDLGRTYTTGEGRQKLFTEDDIRKIPQGRVLIVWTRLNPILAYTYGIDRHPEYIKGHMPVISGKTHVPLHDTEARAFMRAYEEQRVMDYEAWVARGGNPWAGYNNPKPLYDGPGRDQPAPEIIPYPELEKMALEHSRQAQTEPNDALLREMQTDKPAPPKNTKGKGRSKGKPQAEAPAAPSPAPPKEEPQAPTETVSPVEHPAAQEPHASESEYVQTEFFDTDSPFDFEPAKAQAIENQPAHHRQAQEAETGNHDGEQSGSSQNAAEAAQEPENADFDRNAHQDKKIVPETEQAPQDGKNEQLKKPAEHRKVQIQQSYAEETIVKNSGSSYNESLTADFLDTLPGLDDPYTPTATPKRDKTGANADIAKGSRKLNRKKPEGISLDKDI